MKTGHPVLLTQGEHTIDSTTFKWVKFVTLREPETALANLTIIRMSLYLLPFHCFYISRK